MKKRALLIGGCSEALPLASSLTSKGYHVIAVNPDLAVCRKLAEAEKIDVFHGDATTPRTLESAGAQGAAIAVALTDRDVDNLVACQISKKRFGVQKTISLVSDPRKTDFFYRMGIDSVVCAIASVAGIIEQNALLQDTAALLPMEEGRFRVNQVAVPTGSPAVNRKLWEMNLPQDVIIGCVLRGDKGLVPRGDTRILAGDVLIVITTDEHETPALRLLTGR